MDLTSMKKADLCTKAVELGLYTSKSAARDVKIEELRSQIAKALAEDTQDEQSMGDDIVVDTSTPADEHVDSPLCGCVTCCTVRVARTSVEAKIEKLLSIATTTRNVPFASRKRREAAKTALKLARRCEDVPMSIVARCESVRAALSA